MILNDIKKENPLFSIIVPAYNSAAFINKCIESVLTQTFLDFELILVDDGSKDDTLKICKEYAENDYRIKVIHKENGGHTSARNEGLIQSKGVYIIFLDSDDWIDSQTLEGCADEIACNHSDVIIFSMKNSTDKNAFSVLIQDGYYKMDDVKSLVMDKLILSVDGKFVFPKSLSAKCFKRDIIYESQLSTPKEVLIGEDSIAFVGSMLKATNISVLANDSRLRYNCLVRSFSISRSADADAFQKTKILLEHYEKVLLDRQIDLREQFKRDVVAQLYTAGLLAMRAGVMAKEVNRELMSVLKSRTIAEALRKAKFNCKGYKFIVKKFILKNRLWWLARLIDQSGRRNEKAR